MSPTYKVAGLHIPEAALRHEAVNPNDRSVEAP